MPDLLWLADLGRASVAALWLPVAAWSAVALVAEAALRLGRPPAALALPVRGAVLAALPLAVLVPPALAALAPEAAGAVAAAVPDVLWLPEVAVGGPAPVVEAAGPARLDVLLGLGVLAVVLVGAYRVVELLHALGGVARARRAFPPSSPEGQAAVDAARRRLGVARPVAAAEAPPGAAPFTVGWRRPVVALPARLDAAAREVAAVHEVAHVRRSDFAWHAAQRAVAAVFGAHPLVWTLGRGLDLDRERAADALVLDACPGQRRAYADLLFSYAALPAPALALGAARGSSSLKSRIDAMTTPLSPAQSRRLGRLGRLAALVAVGLTVVGAAAMAPARSMAPSGAGGTAAADSLGRLIDRVDVWRGDGVRIVVQLKDGTTHDDAVAVLDLADAGSEGTQAASLEVLYDGGSVRRDVRLADGFTQLGLHAVSNIGGAVLPIQHSDTAGRDTTDQVYEVADDPPVLVGGLDGIAGRVQYPEPQRRAGVEGTAILQFIVEKDGTVGELQVIRSAGNDGLDRAAMAAVRPSRFEPGRVDGEPVRVRFAVPVTFRLPEGEGGPSDGRVREVRPDPEGEDGVYGVVDDMPQLIGGLQGLQDRVVYPQVAKDAGIEGQVIVQFIVNEAGRVEDPVVLRSPDDALSEAALAAVRESRFEPGRTDGEAVKVRFAVPITFRLPAGDGVDRGSHSEGDGSGGADGVVRYSGLDVALLAPGSRQAFTGTLRGLPEILARDDTPSSEVEVRYTVGSSGRVVETKMSEAPPALRQLAAFLLGTVRLDPGRRPETAWTGTFRLSYQADA